MRSRQRYPLEPASAAAILGTDWLVYLLSSFFELEMLGRAVIAGALFCGIVVFLVEDVSRPSSPGVALTKGAVATGAVAAPGALVGTALALGALAWSTRVYLARRFDRSRH